MIDYYKGIDTQTGEEIPYLAELKSEISRDQSAEIIYRRLFQMEERLEARSSYHHLDRDSEKLARILPEVKVLFITKEAKQAYDRKLSEAYAYRQTSYNITKKPPKEQLLHVTVGDMKSISKEKKSYFSQYGSLILVLSLALLILGICVLWFGMSPAIFIIFILVVALLGLVT